MKYAIAIFVTAVIILAGSYLYFKGIPKIPSYSSNSVSTESGVTTPAMPQDETSMVVAAVRTSLVAKHGQQAADMNITMSKVEGDYAKGSATEAGGGGMWFAAKVNGNWVLVWDGNGQINCSDIAPYPNFPTDLIPECWDTARSRLIIR